MNTKKKIVIASTVIIVLLLVSVFCTARLLTNVDNEDYTAQAQKIFDQAKRDIEIIRNITLPSNVVLHVITKQDAVNMWGRPSADADLTNILRQEKIYKGLFLMAENESLYEATVEWTANWGAATVGKNDIYVIKENFDPWAATAEATFIHELMHIWQPALKFPITFDEDKARSSLVEGDASYMGDYFLNFTFTSPSPNSATISGTPAFLIDNPLLNQLNPIPDSVWKLNFFPYDFGKTFVSALYQQGGFPTVNQAYKPDYTPITTEQILHPDKYFSNETAQKVAAPTLTESNWGTVKTNRGEYHESYGEYFIQVMLGNHLSKAEALTAASGWGADNFTYYERDSEYLFTWNIEWDTACDTNEFYVAFNNVLNATGAVKQNCTHWSVNGRYISIALNQNENTTLIACSPNEAAVLPTYFK